MSLNLERYRFGRRKYGRKKRSKRAKIGLNLFSLVTGEVEIQETTESDNWVRYGDRIAIRVCSGDFWQTDIFDSDIVSGKGKQIGDWEIYKIVLAEDEFASNRGQFVRYGDNVAFVSLINQRFVGANHNGQGELTARVTAVGPLETFHLECPPNKKRPIDRKLRFGSWFALKSSNGKYVMFDRDNSKQLLATIDWIKEWESFVIMNPLDQS